MADIKLESDYWETSGIRDRTQNKTQRQINASLQADITDIQSDIGDMDNLDTQATNLVGAANELKGSLNSNESAIAIISNGNTHIAISEGQYVYVKNHSTISEGLYKAKTAIAANATLTLNTNIESVSKGAVNDLFDTAYTTDGLTFVDWTTQGEYGKVVYRYGGYCKIGRLVIVNMRVSITDNVIASGSEMITGLPPVAIDAASNIAVGAVANNQNKNITLTQGGIIAATDSIPVTNMIALFCCYLTY